MLHAKREMLLEELRAVDRAIAALATEDSTVANALPEPPTEATADEATNRVVPVRVRSPRVVTAEHRQALNEGARKARHTRDAAAGRAREPLGPTSGLATPSTATPVPRLVKREETVSEPMRTADRRPPPRSPDGGRRRTR